MPNSPPAFTTCRPPRTLDCPFVQVKVETPFALLVQHQSKCLLVWLCFSDHPRGHNQHQQCNIHNSTSTPATAVFLSFAPPNSNNRQFQPRAPPRASVAFRVCHSFQQQHPEEEEEGKRRALASRHSARASPTCILKEVEKERVR